MKPTIDQLLARYYEGETTLDEENQLRAYFQHTESIPDHLLPHASLFQYVTSARAGQLSPDFTTRLDQKLDPQPVRAMGRVRQLTTWGMRLAAGVALLLIGFAGGQFYSRQSPDAAESVELVTTGHPAGESIRKTLAFDAVAQTSASDRIHAINQSAELDRADREITQLLINTLNFDANVNVRLAACQALVRFEQEEGVREALIQSLRIQKDPNVQLTLIDALVAIKEKRAAADMQRLARNQQVLDIVRLKAEEGAGALIRAAHSPS